MTEKQRIRWEGQRKKGKWFFILKFTVIWFVTLFILSNLVRWIFGYATPDTSLFNLIFQLVWGFLMGFYLWESSEKRFRNT